jgi:hypothetical protein
VLLILPYILVRSVCNKLFSYLNTIGEGTLLCVSFHGGLCGDGYSHLTHYKGSKYTLQTSPGTSHLPKSLWVGEAGMLRQGFQEKPM